MPQSVRQSGWNALRKMRLLVVRSKFWTPGADLDFFCAFVQGRTSGDRDRRIRRNAGACQGKRTQIRSGAGACAGGFGDLHLPTIPLILLISRNVSAYYPEPSEGLRGNGSEFLKPNGVLLNFLTQTGIYISASSVREEAIRRERLGLEKYHSGYTHDGSYEYIDSELNPENYRVFGKAQRPDFDLGVLAQLPYKEISFERDVTEELWSEREKLFYGATPLYMIRAVKQ